MGRKPGRLSAQGSRKFAEARTSHAIGSADLADVT